MSIGKRRTRRAVLAICATVLTSLTVSGGGPPGGGHDDTQTPSQTQTPPAAVKDDRSQLPDSSAKGRTIRVETRLQVGEELDLGASGRSVGDQFVFSGDLVSAEEPDGPPVGTIGGFCVITELERNAGQCSLTAVLEDGQITVQGEQEAIPTPRPVTNAIAGGTGKFRNAQGEMALKFLTPPVWELTFTLTRS